MKRLPLFGLISLLVAALLLSSCENGVDFLINSSEETETEVTSQDIAIPIEKIRTLNPVISRDEDTYYIDKLIYEGLFVLDENLQAQPLLARSYSYEDDGYSMIINLRSGVRWHDGEVFDADDVKFSIDAYLDVFYASPSLYNGYVDNIKSAKVRDDLTIQIYFRRNTDVSAEKLTFPIIAKHQFKKVSAVRKNAEQFVPVGTGPYKVESVDVNKEIILSGNADYHGNERAQNRVCFRVLPDRLDAVNLLGINDLNVTLAKDIDRDTLLNNKEIRVKSFPSNEAELIGFNCRRGVTANSKVRQALVRVVDIEEILTSAYYNSGVRSDTVYYPGYMGTDSKDDLVKPNEKKAKDLLSEAGYLDRDENGFLEDENGEEVYLDVLVNSEDSSRLAAAQIIEAGLARLNLHVTVTKVDWQAYSAKLAAGDYDLYIGGYRIQDNFDMRFLLHSGMNNPAGYSNSKLDELLDRMESGVSAAEKREAFQKAKRILVKEVPYYCMFYKTYGLLSSEGLTGEAAPYFFNPYNGCENWAVTYKIKKQPE